MKQQQGLPWWAWLGGAVLLVVLISLVIWALFDSGDIDVEETPGQPVISSAPAE